MSKAECNDEETHNILSGGDTHTSIYTDLCGSDPTLVVTRALVQVWDVKV
jgi:hypothetical protein